MVEEQGGQVGQGADRDVVNVIVDGKKVGLSVVLRQILAAMEEMGKEVQALHEDQLELEARVDHLEGSDPTVRPAA